MLSPDNAFSEEDVVDFVARIRRFLNLKEDEPVVFTAEPKIDGLSMSLRYEGGSWCGGHGARRQRRRRRHRQCEGSDIRTAKGKAVPDVCEVRGEVYMTKPISSRSMRAAESCRGACVR
jgi:DNA ligase (NAD+)